jgi:lysozyme
MSMDQGIAPISKINPKVVDISHYDDVEFVEGRWVGFEKLKAAGYIGVINKATQGRGMIDISYSRRRLGAINAGLVWGAYHFLDATDPIEQAAHFLDFASPDDNTLLALDHETRGVPLGSARIFLETVHRSVGRWPWLYSGFLIKDQIGNEIDPFWRQIQLWLSHYSSKPTWPPCWEKPTLWQFTGDGIGPGPHEAPGIFIQGGCDINSWDGTDDELRAAWVA